MKQTLTNNRKQQEIRVLIQTGQLYNLLFFDRFQEVLSICFSN
jgi:hypothetical protein